MKRKLLILITTFMIMITTAPMVALADTEDSTMVIPVSANYTKGQFSFVISEDPSLGLETTIDTPRSSLEFNLIDNEAQIKLDSGTDVVITATLIPFDYATVKDIVEQAVEVNKNQKQIAFDINLSKQIDGTNTPITETPDTIRFRIKAPEDLDTDKISSAKIITIHQNADLSTTIIITPVFYDKATDTVYFDIGKFSDFVFLYDKKTYVAPSPDPEPDPAPTPKPKPKTGDDITITSPDSSNKNTEVTTLYPSNYTQDNTTTGAKQKTEPQTITRTLTKSDPSGGTTSHFGFQTSDSIIIFILIGIVILSLITLVILLTKKEKED